MTASALLSKLDGVRRTGENRWLARCPAHDDKHPSLAIRQLADGRVLIHDFAGCAANEVLEAVGLDFDALFPEKTPHGVSRERRPFHAEDVLRAVGEEAGIVAIVAARIFYGHSVDITEYERMMLGAARLANAAVVANVDREYPTRELLARIRDVHRRAEAEVA
jgi:hypothetical protein